MSESGHPSAADTPRVCVVIPVRNEAANIPPLVAEIVAALDGRYAFEIIYANDGSSDDTDEVLAALMQREPRLRHVRHARPSGQSNAVPVRLSTQ